MERRRDYRHALRYMLSVRCARTSRVLSDLATIDISASGLLMAADHPHGLVGGDQLEVQLFARVELAEGEDSLVMATDATVVRTEPYEAAVRFRHPLSY